MGAHAIVRRLVMRWHCGVRAVLGGGSRRQLHESSVRAVRERAVRVSARGLRLVKCVEAFLRGERIVGESFPVARIDLRALDFFDVAERVDVACLETARTPDADLTW